MYESLVSKRLQEGEDPYPITYCQRVPSQVYEEEKNSGVAKAMLDLLEQIVSNPKMGDKEKRKKLKKFKEAYPDIYMRRFPTEESEPEVVRLKKQTGRSLGSKFASLSVLKNAIRM